MLACLACVASAFLLFAFIFKWQIYHTRLHLPLLVLAAAPIGAVLERLGRVTGSPWLVNILTRPLVGERSVFLHDGWSGVSFQQPALRGEFERAAEAIEGSGCKSVGVVMSNDGCGSPPYGCSSGAGTSRSGTSR